MYASLRVVVLTCGDKSLYKDFQVGVARLKDQTSDSCNWGILDPHPDMEFFPWQYLRVMNFSTMSG